MKPTTTLKELLKPPFTFDKDLGIILDNNEMVLDDFADVHCTDEEMPMIAEFIVAALNEKWERDFGNPLRWRLGDSFGCDTLNCPYCGIEYRFETLPNWENQLLSSLRTAVIAVKGGTN